MYNLICILIRILFEVGHAICWDKNGVDTLHPQLRPPMLKFERSEVQGGGDEEDYDEDEDEDEEGRSSKVDMSEYKKILFKQLSIHDSTFCGLLLEDSSLYCWGYHLHTSRPFKEAFTSPGPYKQLSAGGHGICAILEKSSKLECFGMASLHALEAISAEDTREWEEIFVGTYATCGITTEATVHCFGIFASIKNGMPLDLEVA